MAISIARFTWISNGDGACSSITISTIAIFAPAGSDVRHVFRILRESSSDESWHQHVGRGDALEKAPSDDLQPIAEVEIFRELCRARDGVWQVEQNSLELSVGIHQAAQEGAAGAADICYRRKTVGRQHLRDLCVECVPASGRRLHQCRMRSHMSWPVVVDAESAAIR